MAETTPSHYNKQCPGCGLKLDPYRIARLYGAQEPQSHIIKKALCPGDRGHKELREDIENIIASCQRWLEILDEDEKNEGASQWSK